MANTKIYADGGAITVWWELPNFAANPKNPTAEEINAGIDITRVISWNDFSFNAEASDQTSDPAVGDVGNVQTRSFANYGGTISFYYPRDYSNTADEALDVFEALETPRTLGYLVIRADGLKTTSTAKDPLKPAVTNDFVSIYKVISDGWQDVVASDNSYRYTITFQPQGELWSFARVGSVGTIAAPTVVGGTSTIGTGDKIPLSAFLASRTLVSLSGKMVGYPGWFQWVSSDPDIASVDANGVVTGVSEGTASITARWPHTGTASTALTITVDDTP